MTIKTTMLFFSNIYLEIASVTFLTTGDPLKSTLKSYRRHTSFFQNIAISGRFSKIQKIDFTLMYERTRAHHIATHFSNPNYQLSNLRVELPPCWRVRLRTLNFTNSSKATPIDARGQRSHRANTRLHGSGG